MQVTTPRVAVPAPAQAQPVAGGLAIGYRDGDGIVETKLFPNGIRAEGWQDSPAGLENNYKLGTVRVE